MDTSRYPHLDEIVWRLQQFPEIEALLEYGYNGEPFIQPPPISVAGLTDVGLIVQLQAHVAAYFRRIAYVAGGSAVAVRAMDAIRASLTAADVRAIRVEYANTPVIDLDSTGPRDNYSDVINLIMERLLLSDDQFQRSCELAQAIGRHIRNKK